MNKNNSQPTLNNKHEEVMTENVGGNSGQQFFMMPEDWKPGMPLRIPDPNDPTKFIEISPDMMEIVAEVPVPPKIQADLGGEQL